MFLSNLRVNVQNEAIAVKQFLLKAQTKVVLFWKVTFIRFKFRFKNFNYMRKLLFISERFSSWIFCVSLKIKD